MEDNQPTRKPFSSANEMENSKQNKEELIHTVSPRSLDPFCMVSYYIKWAKTSWKHKPSFSIILFVLLSLSQSKLGVTVFFKIFMDVRTIFA